MKSGACSEFGMSKGIPNLFILFYTVREIHSPILQKPGTGNGTLAELSALSITWHKTLEVLHQQGYGIHICFRFLQSSGNSSRSYSVSKAW